MGVTVTTDCLALDWLCCLGDCDPDLGLVALPGRGDRTFLTIDLVVLSWSCSSGRIHLER